MTNGRKLARIRALVRKRREANAGSTAGGYTARYRKIGDFHGGVFDLDDHVVPWSVSAFNLSAEIMLIAQDWASEDFLSEELDPEQLRLGHSPHLPSNQNLFRLLKIHLDTSFEETFATDAFVFVKPGKMSARIPVRDLRRSALDYALPQVEIVKPKAVVCIGSATYNALRHSLGRRYTSIDISLGEEPIRLGSVPIFGVNHTGGLATIFGGGPEAQERQWLRLAKAISRYA